MPEPEPAAALALKREALATGRTRHGTVSAAGPGGRLRHFHLTVSPTRRAGRRDRRAALHGGRRDRSLAVRRAPRGDGGAGRGGLSPLRPRARGFADQRLRAGRGAALHLHAQPAAGDRTRRLHRPHRRRPLRRDRPAQAAAAEAPGGRERRGRVGRAGAADRRRAALLLAAPRAEDRRGGRGRGRGRHRGRPDRAAPLRAEHAARHARADPPLEEPARGRAGDGAQDRQHRARHPELRPRLLVAAAGDRGGAGPAGRRVLVRGGAARPARGQPVADRRSRRAGDQRRRSRP